MELVNNDFIELYLKWLKSNMTMNDIGQYVQITTPFLDRHNDHIQIYVKKDGDKFILTDDGYTINDLLMIGCDLDSNKRKNILNSLVNGLGVIVDGEELTAEANLNNFAQKKHSLLQAILSVNDMFMLSQNRVMGVFLDDVQNFLEEYDIRYTPSPQFFGKSGLAHTFDFVIPSSKKMPERLIRTVNNPSREKTESIIFSYNDIKDSRPKETSMFVFINDSDKILKNDISNAFVQYGIKPVLWTKRHEAVEKLLA